MLSEERIMEIAECCPVWYAIPQGREVEALIGYILRNITPEYVLHSANMENGLTVIWITRAGDDEVLWEDELNLPFKGWVVSGHKRYHRLVLPEKFCLIKE